MEILPLIVLLAAPALIVLLHFRSKKDNNVQFKESPWVTARTTKPANRFDRTTANHVPKLFILTGPAWVVDGDTIKINKTQIRSFGIDAPELNHPYGKQAKWALHKLCKGHFVTAKVTEKDAYGRTVARCYLPDGRDLSAEMVKMGLALDWPKFSEGAYRSMGTPDARRKLFLADARQKGRIDIWTKFENKSNS